METAFSEFLHVDYSYSMPFIIAGQLCWIEMLGLHFLSLKILNIFCNLFMAWSIAVKKSDIVFFSFPCKLDSFCIDTQRTFSFFFFKPSNFTRLCLLVILVWYFPGSQYVLSKCSLKYIHLISGKFPLIIVFNICSVPLVPWLWIASLGLLVSVCWTSFACLQDLSLFLKSF